MDKERIAWLRLLRSTNIGPRTFAEIMKFFGSAENAISHLPEMMNKVGRRGKAEFKLVGMRQVEAELENVEKSHSKMIYACDAEYPELLRSIPDFPPIITVCGDVSLLQKPQISIVGARNASYNGCKFAKRIAHEIAKEDIVITSGLARGIDAAAHLGSVEFGSIGVIASGIDHIYPKENKYLYEKLYESGLIISEYPMGTAPIAQFFPQRNRIISGLAYGVLVVEAAYKSGTLITARLALEQGREVFAVPGSPLEPRCQGTNKLIKDGAYLVEKAEDILSVLRCEVRSRSQMLDSGENNQFISVKAKIPSEEEVNNYRQQLRGLLSYMPTSIDEIIEHYQLPVNVVNWLIVEMEIMGEIKCYPGNKVCLLSD